MGGYFTITIIMATGMEPIVMDGTTKAWGSLEEAIVGVGGKVVLPAPSGNPHEFLILPEEPGSDPKQPYVVSAAIPHPAGGGIGIAALRKASLEWMAMLRARTTEGSDE